MSILNNLALLSTTGATPTTTAVQQVDGVAGFLMQYSGIIMLVIMFVAMYFLMIRPQKKKEKETQDMRSNIQIGDEIVTIGGVVGIVVAIREDTIVLETGSERTKVRFQRWAIQANNTVHDEQ